MKIIDKIVLGLIGILFIIQFFPIDKHNPEVNDFEDFVVLTHAPEDISNLLRGACYDCHSHETVFPWYSSFAPVSWWIEDHIKEGRDELNFSLWGTYDEEKRQKKLEEIFEEVEEGEMPLKPYVNMHAEAELSSEQVELLTSWVKQVHDNYKGGHDVEEDTSSVVPEEHFETVDTDSLTAEDFQVVEVDTTETE